MTTRGRSVLRGLSFLALGLLLTLPVACESDSGDDGGNGGNGGSDTVSGDEWRATLQDFQTKQNIPDGECWLLYNVYYGDDDPSDGCTPAAEAGMRVPTDQMPAGATQPITSGANGELSMPLPADTYWGFECDKGGDTNDYRVAYQYNIDSDTRSYDGEEIWVISNGLYTLAPTLAGITQDETQGVVAGRLVWYNAEGGEEYVGCATIQLEVYDDETDAWVPVEEDTSQVRYFADNDLPTTIDQREQTNPINGLYIGANMPVGPDGGQRRVRMSAWIDGEKVSEDDIFAAPNSVVINNMEVGRGLCHEAVGDFPANPTPESCR